MLTFVWSGINRDGPDRSFAEDSAEDNLNFDLSALVIDWTARGIVP